MRKLFLSLFLATGGSIAAQSPPTLDPPKLTAPPAVTPPPVISHLTLDKGSAKPATMEEAIAAALRNHPDVKLAEAKRMVADAELEQAKLLVTQRITNAYAKVEQAKARMQLAERQFNTYRKLSETGQLSTQELGKAEADLLTAKSELAAAEADLRAATGAPKTGATLNLTQPTFGVRSIDLTSLVINDLAVDFAARTSAVKRPDGSSGKLRDLIDKKVALDLKQQSLPEVFEALMKTAGGSGLTLRLPDTAKKEFVKEPAQVGPLKGEQTFLAWAQLIMDDFNDAKNQNKMLPGQGGRFEIYVRDYGLLVTLTNSAPGGAQTLGEYARQYQAEKAAKPPETKKPVESKP